MTAEINRRLDGIHEQLIDVKISVAENTVSMNTLSPLIADLEQRTRKVEHRSAMAMGAVALLTFVGASFSTLLERIGL